MRTTARSPGPVAVIADQIPLPLTPVASPDSAVPPDPLATTLLPQQVWNDLPAPRRQQIRLIFLQVLQEVVGDARHHVEPAAEDGG